MNAWAMDGGAVRRAHQLGALDVMAAPMRLVLSSLTWLPTPGAHLVPGVKPELRYPDPGRVSLRTATIFDSAPDSDAGVCDALELLHADGVVALADGEGCAATRVARIEGAWRAAGRLAPLMDESVAALLIAELDSIPLVTDDHAVLHVARHLSLPVMTADEFAVSIAA